MKLDLGPPVFMGGKAGFYKCYKELSESPGDGRLPAPLTVVDSIALRIRVSTDSLKEALRRLYEA